MSNPFISSIEKARVGYGAGTATFAGTMQKLAVLVVVAAATGAFAWNAPGEYKVPMLIAGLVGGLAFAFWTIFVPSVAPYTAPVYAALEGLVLGVVSQVYEGKYHDIVAQALAITTVLFVTVYLLYVGRVLRATKMFVRVIVAATLGVLVLYVVNIFVSIFTGSNIPYVFDGWWGLLVSTVIVIIASMNLVIDFAIVDDNVERGASKRMEWYAAFGLMVTLVWLYLEVVRWLGLARGKK